MNELTPSRHTTPPAHQITLTSYGSLEQMFKVADYISKSPIVPQAFAGNPGSVLIALNMASRLNLDPFMVMQNIYVVHGNPGMSGKFAIALLNRSPKYRRIEYRYVNGKDYKSGIQIVGHRVDDPDDKAPDYGTAITPDMVHAEGWDKNPKWKSMTEQMLRYRAAAFFARAFCPEELMGMQTIEELDDMEHASGMRRASGKLIDNPFALATPMDETETPENLPDIGRTPNVTQQSLNLTPEQADDDR